MLKNQNVMIKNSILMLLSFAMFFCSTITANAAVKNDDVISPCYTNINSTLEVYSVSGITATCTSSIKASKSTSLTIKMELQKKKSDGYKTIKMWTDSKKGISLSMSESRNINVLCDYRLKVTYTAGNETTVVYKY